MSGLSPRWIQRSTRRVFARHRRRSHSIRGRSDSVDSKSDNVGLRGFNSGPTRTATGLGVNLPQNRCETRSSPGQRFLHYGQSPWKFGVDSGATSASTLQTHHSRFARVCFARLLVKDLATRANINKDLPGTARVLHNDWQTSSLRSGRVEDSSQLHLNARTPLRKSGQPIQISLTSINQCCRGNNDPRFILQPVPGGRDNNNFQQERLKRNRNERRRIVMGWLTGGDRLVVRGGYRAHTTMRIPTSR